jgi:hypothetical protein
MRAWTSKSFASAERFDAPDIRLRRQGEQLLDLLQRESEALRATNKA